MSKGNINDENQSKRLSKKQFDFLLKICLIIGIIVVSGFIIYYIFTPEPGYVTFGILNENQEAENYPTEATINESVSFYLTVENKLVTEFSFSIKIKKGNNNTVLSSIGSNGTLEYEVNDSLNYSNIWISNKLNVSFSQLGANQIIIAELWRISSNEIEKFFDILWLRLNITS
ncbi:MAG: DUF1616 domain-containing protein [Promethearchaeota archaeon]|jgi:uncharacterized membrane protein